MDTDTLTPAMEASFNRIDAILAQILNRFQETIDALDHKISLSLTTRSLCPPVLDRGDSFLPGDDISVGFFVSDRKISWPSTIDAALSDGPQFQACKLGLEVVTHTPSVALLLDPCDVTAEISDGSQLFVRCDSLLPHSDVDDFSGGLLISEGTFMPPETPQPLNDVMDQKGKGYVVIEVGLAGIHKCMPSVAHMGLLSDAIPDQWAKEVAEILMQSLVSVYGNSFKIEALGVFAPFVAHESRGLHALHPFVEMQYSGALCHGNAIPGFDLSYYMGIRDKGGGFEVLQKELHHQGFIKNCLVVIFLASSSLHNFIDLALVKGLSWPVAHIHQSDFLRSNFLLANGGMVLSHGCSQVRFRVQDFGCVDDFELFTQMGIRDKRGGFIGWIWRTYLRWFMYKITRISYFSCMNASASAQEWRLLCFLFQKTAWLAMFYMCIPSGIAVGYVYGGFVGDNFSWRYAFWGEAFCLLPFAVLAFAMNPLQLKGFAPADSRKFFGT